MNAITTKFIKKTSFIFIAITSFVFGAITKFVFEIIARFVLGAINLLYNCNEKYLIQIKVKLKKIIIYLDQIYLYCIHLCKYFCYKN